ncbi:MAG TPA: arginine--tRNA ligase, partial [Oscillospiraceae bacterium]|nr:arginine--tRNA ligase [Oscillospiraceae bacterium]
MSYLVKKAEDTIYEAINLALDKAVAAGLLPKEDLPAFIVEVPANRANGDFSANAAMVWARSFKTAPRNLAQTLADNMDLGGTFFDKFEIAGPGFMNFYLNDEYYARVILDIIEKGDGYGRSDFGKGKKINVEFVSANPTGPMHMGNARGAALGDCLASVMDWAGFEVSREFYVNDAGNQIEKFALSLDIRYRQLFLGLDAVELPEDSYHGEDIIEIAKEFAQIHGDKYMDASEADRKAALVSYAL